MELVADLCHVGPALAASGFGGAHLKGVLLAGGVGGIGGLLPEQAAQVDEMLLVGLLLAGGDELPFGYEVLRVNSGMGNSVA